MWETNKSETVYQNPFFHVNEDDITRENGSKGKYYVVNLPEAVFIIARENEKICMIKQFSYPNKSISWELPAGSIDVVDGEPENPLVTAKRELIEEAGLEATDWTYQGYIYLTPRLTNNRCHIYVAEGLKKVSQDIQEEESIIDCKMMDMPDICKLISDGTLADGPTLAVLSKVILSNISEVLSPPIIKYGKETRCIEAVS